MSQYAPSIHEIFNARNSTTSALCESFIVNEYYTALASPSHSIMVGPRGSGKTTLMKMLQVEAIENWSNDVAAKFRNDISFSGVFVPTDRVWKTQYDSIKENTCNVQNFDQYINFVFTYHILERLMSVLHYRTNRTLQRKHKFRYTEISKDDEASLVSNLADLWCVSPAISSFRNLQFDLSRKKIEISDYISKINLAGEDYSIKAPEVAVGTLIQILDLSTKTINSYLARILHEKW